MVVGSGGEVKGLVGGSDVQGVPAVNAAQVPHLLRLGGLLALAVERKLILGQSGTPAPPVNAAGRAT
jgi:hypothetical protein